MPKQKSSVYPPALHTPRITSDGDKGPYCAWADRDGDRVAMCYHRHRARNAALVCAIRLARKMDRRAADAQRLFS